MSTSSPQHTADHQHEHGQSPGQRHHHGPDVDPGMDPQEFWDGFYIERGQIWSGNPNQRLVEGIAGMSPGRALDLGCGEGGDAVYLAENGWQVTAVDVADTPLSRTRAHAEERGVSEHITTERQDLAKTFPEGEFDLISAQFLMTPLDFPRDQALRNAAEALSPGGLLLIVDHGSAPDWGWAGEGHTDFPSPQELYDGIGLDSERFVADRLESLEREATGPEGQKGMILDTVVAVRRVA